MSEIVFKITISLEDKYLKTNYASKHILNQWTLGGRISHSHYLSQLENILYNLHFRNITNFAL